MLSSPRSAVESRYRSSGLTRISGAETHPSQKPRLLSGDHWSAATERRGKSFARTDGTLTAAFLARGFLHLSLPSPLLDILGRALQEILNRALALDPAAAARLRALSGRSVELTWSTADIGLRLAVEDGVVTVGPRHGQGSADLGVSGSLAGLLSLAGLGRGGAGAGQRVDISGDAQLAREIEKIVRDAAPDLEAAFAQRFGDTAGPVMARSFTGAWTWARESAESLREDIGEYLVDESGDVIGEVELASFNRDVDTLRDRVERLDQSIARLRRAGQQR